MQTALARDEEGYLVHPEDWSKEVAMALAQEEGVELAQAHWPVLNFMRDYHAEHGVTADIRHVVAFLVATQGVDKKAAKHHIFQLFPYGYVKQACKIAGMIRPRAWSTG